MNLLKINIFKIKQILQVLLLTAIFLGYFKSLLSITKTGVKKH